MLSISQLSAFTTADRTSAASAFNNAFFVANGGNAYYKKSTSDPTVQGFWKSAELIELIIDSYMATGSLTQKNMITQLCNGFIAEHGTDWSANTFNDDCMWACIAFIRAYSQTGNATFANIAKSNFDMVYARGWDAALGGGIWWTTAKTTKNACVNGPAAIMAYRLYQYTGTASYLTKAQNIHDWLSSILYNSTNGQVYDKISSAGVVTTTAFSYNQGTFMGACHYLGDTVNRTKAGDFVQNTWGTNMQLLGQGGDGGGFNGICLRWMKTSGYGANYRKAVANNAWSKRRTSDNLCWNKWDATTPAGTLYSWDCSSVVSALMNANPD